MKLKRPPIFALTFALLTLASLGALAPRACADAGITGVLSQVSVSQRALTVNIDGAALSVSVPASAWITLDWIDCDLINLRAGEQVQMVVTAGASGWIASRVAAQSPWPKKLVRGTIQNFLLGFIGALIMPKGSALASTPVLIDSATIVVRNSASANVADLNAGDQVTVLATVQPNGDLLANYVEATAPVSKALVAASGFVKSVSDGQIVVKTWQNQTEMTLTAGVGTLIQRDQGVTTLSGLTRGDQITAIGVRNDSGGMNAWLVTALSPGAQLMGTIVDLHASDGLITVAPLTGGPTISLRILAPTILQVNGNDAELNDARLGDVAFIRADPSVSGPWTAVSIEIPPPATGK
jgi:hypothetical protein